ncbi:MAG: type I-B CRISPR-associated protein Cas7/Cst2/DevR [Bacteroidales bacterium]
MENLKAQGFILIDVDVVALNNAGENESSNNENAVATKRVYKDGKCYVYVSGQAWRYWWRDTLQKTFKWNLSPITRDRKIAFTAADPMEYADDDIFGYMKVNKEEIEVEDKIGDKKKKKQDNTVTRISPLKNSVLVSVAPVSLADNFSSMSRQNDDPVPYSKEEYSAILKGMFSIDLEQVGTFSSYNKSGYKNMTEAYRNKMLENNVCIEIDAPFVKNEKLVRLFKNIRIKRATETILALKNLSGGAMQTCNLGDVTPKLIILATLNSGNHPFSHITSSKAKGKDNHIFDFNIDGLKEVLNDYKENIRGNIFIGRRTGFLDEKANELKALETEFPNVKVFSINEAIDRYAKQLKEQM